MTHQSGRFYWKMESVYEKRGNFFLKVINENYNFI
jgi:hypothetical protein